MQKSNRTLLILISVISLMLVLVIGLMLLMTFCVYAGGRFLPKDAEVLDLRGKKVSMENYQDILRKFPDSTIFWDVPFQDTGIANTETEITITSLSDGDVAQLDYLTALQTVRAEGCTDYAQLAELQLRHPQAKVLYSVTVGGSSYDQDTTSLNLKGLTEADAAALKGLTRLTEVSVSGCDNYALLRQLQQENPQWNLRYTVSLNGETLPWDQESLELKGATAEELETALSALPRLTSLRVSSPEAEMDELLALREAYPQSGLVWDVEIYGKTVTSDTTELDISGIQVESCGEVEKLARYLPDLEKLIMSDCGIDSETMAEFRERQRENYKVVWTVYLSKKAKVRTDETYFMPIQQGEYYLQDQHTPELKYCEDMVCIDVGHHTIHNIDFVAYMPHLKYLILAHTEVQDISPISNCKELVYLELDWSTVRDYSPLLGCTALEDLNLNKTYCDLTPITQMTWLKNLWIPGRGYTDQQEVIAALPNTRVFTHNTGTPGEGWRNLPNYYAMRDYLGMHYMN